MVDYYNLNNWGFGTLLDVPWPRPVPAFHSAFERPCLQSGFGAASSCRSHPIGGSMLTPWTIPTDRPAPCPSGIRPVPPLIARRQGDSPGRVSRRSPAAHLESAAGDEELQHVADPAVPDTGIYLTPPGGAHDDARVRLELVVNDPAYNEYLARAVVPYATIYGQQPVELPWLPQSLSAPTAGSPYGLVGSASVRRSAHRELSWPRRPLPLAGSTSSTRPRTSTSAGTTG